MSERNDPRHDAYDVVVVGAGLGGLSAAGFLARAGLTVCLVERGEAAGGCVAGLRRGPYALDPAGGSIARGVEDELRDGILAHLGARDRCELIPLDRAYRVAFRDLELDVPVGLEAMIEAHAERFPKERDAIAAFFRTCDRVLEDTHRLPLVLGFRELDALADRFPTFVRYRSATLAEALDEFFADARLKAAVAATWPLGGLPPSRLSFSTFAQGLALAARGSFAVRGSFARLVDALLAGFVDAGGTYLPGAEVVRIRVAHGRVAGVEVAGGGALEATSVVSNADASATLMRLVGTEHLPSDLPRKLTRMRPSVSAHVTFVATSEEDFGATAVETFHENGTWVSAPTLADVTLEPPGEHLLAIKRLAGGAPSDSLVPDGVAPLAELAPADLERRTGNRDGAIYGWENTPQNTGSRRLGLVGPVEGLYLAGHWAQPGHGIYRALLSGMHAARALLAKAGAADAIPEFRSTAE